MNNRNVPMIKKKWFKVEFLADSFEPKSTLQDIKEFEASNVWADMNTWMDHEIGVCYMDIQDPNLNIVQTQFIRGKLMELIKMKESFCKHTFQQVVDLINKREREADKIKQDEEKQN